MRRRDALKAFGGIAGAGILGTGTTSAQDCGDHIVPGGPFPPDTANINYGSFTSNDELYNTLAKLAEKSNVHYEPIGETWGGRDVPYARVGGGDTDVFYVTQQHGDEQIGTEAALRLLQNFGKSSKPVADILDEVTLHVIPRINPDGWAPVADSEDPNRTNAIGVDPNRQHDYPPGSTDNPSPEAQAMIDKVYEIDADMVVDYHGQFTYRSDDCELINTSLFWPINSRAPQDAVELSKQIVGLSYLNVDNQYGHTVFSRYPGSTNPAIARNAYGIQGRGSVLVEQRGQAADLGNAGNGKLVRIAYAIMTEILEGVATGELYDIDPNVAENMPEEREFYWKDLPAEEYHEHEAYGE